MFRLARSDDCLSARSLLSEPSKASVMVQLLFLYLEMLIDCILWGTVQMSTRNLTGSGPLHVAAYYGNKNMVSLLASTDDIILSKNKVLVTIIIPVLPSK